MDLAQLQQLITEGSANKTASSVLGKRMAEAQALRDSPLDSERQTGYVDPLSAIAGVIKNSKGRQGLRENRPQAEMAERRVNDLGAAKDNYGLTLAANAVQQKQDNFESTAEATVQSALKKATALKGQQDRTYKWGEDKETTRQAELTDKIATAATNLDEKQGIEAGKREGIMKINPETKEAESLTVDDQGILRRNGEVVDNPASWKDYKEPTGGQGAKDFKSPSPAQQKDLEKAGNDMLQLNTVVDSYKPSYAGGSIPLGGSASNFIARNAPIAATPAMEESQNWWASYDLMYTLPERNTLFGGALTGGEAASWEKNAISPNMTDAQIQPRLKELQRIKAAVTARMRESAKLKGWNTPWIDANLAPEDEAAAEEPAGTNRLKTRNDSPDLASLEAQLAELLEKKRRREAGG